MTREQDAVIRRFRKIVRDAHKAGLILAVDAHAWALRFIPREVSAVADDLGEVGEPVSFPDERGGDQDSAVNVPVDSACGTPASNCTTL